VTTVADSHSQIVRVSLKRSAPAWHSAVRAYGVGEIVQPRDLRSRRLPLVLVALEGEGPQEIDVPLHLTVPVPEALDPDVALLVPAVAGVLRVWDTLALEIGDAAVITAGHFCAPLAAVAAGWYGALPVLYCSDGAEVPGTERLPVADGDVLLKTLRERLGGCSGVAALELSGRADVVDSMLEAIPRFTRLGMFGAKRESLTIDYYVNVHRKGLEMVSGVLDPFAALTRQSERALDDIARASRLLHVPARADECRAAMAAAGPWSGSGDVPA
jgi:hypothetical protein